MVHAHFFFICSLMFRTPSRLHFCIACSNIDNPPYTYFASRVCHRRYTYFVVTLYKMLRDCILFWTFFFKVIRQCVPLIHMSRSWRVHFLLYVHVFKKSEGCSLPTTYLWLFINSVVPKHPMSVIAIKYSLVCHGAMLLTANNNYAQCKLLRIAMGYFCIS